MFSAHIFVKSGSVYQNKTIMITGPFYLLCRMGRWSLWFCFDKLSAGEIYSTTY